MLGVDGPLDHFVSYRLRRLNLKSRRLPVAPLDNRWELSRIGKYLVQGTRTAAIAHGRRAQIEAESTQPRINELGQARSTLTRSGRFNLHQRRRLPVAWRCRDVLPGLDRLHHLLRFGQAVLLTRRRAFLLCSVETFRFG